METFDYTPQPDDLWTSGDDRLEVVNVVANTVYYIFNGTAQTTPIKDFIRLAKGSFLKGHKLSRPTNTDMETGITGSANDHARLSPSDSKRWTSCTGAIAYQEANAHRCPKDTGSREANEGTEAHEWAAKVLQGEITLKDVPDSFMPYVGDYVEHCLSLVPDGVKPLVEVQVPLWYQTDQTGTADFGIVTAERVTGRDLKYGAGVLVTSEDNTQLAIYTWSLIKLYEDIIDFTPETIIDLAVYQPRHREGCDQPAWITTYAELEKFCRDIEYRAIQAREGANRVRSLIAPISERDVSCEEILEAAPGLQFKPGEGDGGACRWCKAKAFCEARHAAITENIPDAMELLSKMPDLTKEELKLPVEERVNVVAAQLSCGAPLSNDYLVALFAKKKAISKLLSDVEEYLELRALEGDVIEGTKLVMGREGNRGWIDDEKADTFLANQKISADDRYVKKVISPTQAEKLLKEKLKKSKRTNTRFEDLVTRSAASKVLALADDPRDAVGSGIEAMPNLDDDFEV